MTVSSQIDRVPYTTNGVTTAFPVPFYFLDDTHLLVLYTPTGGDTYTQALGTDYAVTGAEDESGGTVTTTTALAAGTLVIKRNLPIEQLTDYPPNTPFPSDSHERALDYLTMVAQQLQEQISRALTAADTGSEFDATFPEPVPGSLLGFNETGDGFVAVGSSGVGAGSITDVNVSASAGIAASKVAYVSALTGAVSRSLAGKLSDMAHIKDFGAVCDGVADDTVAVQTAINSGAPYLRMSGTVKITSSLVLRAGQTLYLGTGTILKWGGATGGTVLTTPSATVTARPALICEGGVIDLNGAAVGLRLYSTQFGLFDLEFMDSANLTTTQIVVIGADSTTITGSLTGSQNTISNVFRRIVHQGSCSNLLWLQGTAATPAIVTLNVFGMLRCEQTVYGHGVHLDTVCDSNYFEGTITLALNAAAGVRGVSINDDVTIYGCTFNNVIVSYIGTSTSRAGMYFGAGTRWCTVRNLYVEPQNAAEVQSTAVVDGGAISFDCRLTQTVNASTQGVVAYGKGVQQRAANFTNGGQISLPSPGLAVITDIPFDGFILVACSDNSHTSAVAYIRPTATPAAALLSGDSTFVAVGTGSLTSGGGIASKINYYAGSDGKLYISNNIGTGVLLSIACLAGKYA